MANTYDIGDQVRFSCAFSVSGSATDPTPVALNVKAPSGNTAPYTYALAEIIKDSTGNYHKDVAIDEAGIWIARWVGAGAVAAATEEYILVRKQQG